MKRKGLAGLSVTATAVATTAFGLATPAHADSGSVSYDCLIFSTHFDYNATVSVSGPASPQVGDTATVSADFSDLPGVSPVAVDSWSTSGKLNASGAVTGAYDIASGTKTGPVAAKAPIPLGTLTGSVPLTAAGNVDLTVGDITITAVAFGSSVPITCTPKTAPGTLLSLTVAPAVVPVTVSASPVSVALGGTVTVSGTGWGAGAVTLELCDAGGAACSPLDDVSASVAADGTLSGTGKIPAAAATGAGQLKISQGGTAKTVALSVFDPSGPVGTCGSRPATSCGEQKINLTVTGGALTMAQQAGEVSLTPVTLDGTAKTATGNLRQVTVTDARGASTGWTLVGTLTDFKGPAGASIPAGSMSWTPQCAPGAGASAVTSGTPGALGSTASVLCSVTDSTTGPVGGQFTADAGLSLAVPAVTAAGEYDAVLTLTLS